LEKTVAMLNMDMIGRMKDSRLIIGGTGSSPLWKDLLHRLNETAQFELKFQDDGFGPSDHSSFYGKDIPVLFFFTGVHQDYHRPSDDYEKINVRAEARVLGLVAQTAMEISRLDTQPVFSKVKGQAGEMQPRGELRAYLGTIPDYGEEVEGVKLSGVREGSPAAKAGLQGNDVIIEFAGVRIKNVYDYTYVLQEQKPGEAVEIVVLRNGQRIVSKATLGQRP
jgi:C-terminal processing protease CtpA/Prc